MQPAKPPAESAVPRRVAGQRLRDLRNQAGLTMKVAAELMECTTVGGAGIPGFSH
jgi:hypothetical protein